MSQVQDCPGITTKSSNQRMVSMHVWLPQKDPQEGPKEGCPYFFPPLRSLTRKQPILGLKRVRKGNLPGSKRGQDRVRQARLKEIKPGGKWRWGGVWSASWVDWWGGKKCQGLGCVLKGLVRPLSTSPSAESLVCSQMTNTKPRWGNQLRKM